MPDSTGSNGRDLLAEISAVVATWDVRKHEADATNRPGHNMGKNMREFVETMNALTRRLIRALDVEDPSWWESLMELAQNASTLTTKGAKIYADGIDRTNL